MTTLRLIFDWSEVWGLFIPLLALTLGKKQPVFMKPVSIYICLALFINLCGDIIGDFKKHLPEWLRSNTYLYNIHSVVRFICFSYFFYFLEHRFLVISVKILSLLYFLFLIINFGLFENFFNYTQLSGNLLTTESYLLLVYCILYYLSQLISETSVLKNDKAFWVVTGLGLYVVSNFFLFLFYDPMMTESSLLANRMWDIHNTAYIIMSILLAKAYHVPVRSQY